MTGNEMVGWHHPLKGDEFEQALENSKEWGSLSMGSQRAGHH